MSLHIHIHTGDAFHEGSHPRDEHGRFAEAHGYKEVAHSEGKPWQWASKHGPDTQGRTHHINIKRAGSPEQFHASRSVVLPGLSGASQKVGSFSSLQEAHEASMGQIKPLLAAP